MWRGKSEQHTLKVLGWGAGQCMRRLERPWLSVWWSVTEYLGEADLERYRLGSYASVLLWLVTSLGSRARERGGIVRAISGAYWMHI